MCVVLSTSQETFHILNVLVRIFSCKQKLLILADVHNKGHKLKDNE